MQLRAQVERQALWHLRLQHGLVCVKMVCWKACSFSSGESKSATASRNHTRLRTGVTGQMNRAMDSRQPSTAVVPASGILVSTAA